MWTRKASVSFLLLPLEALVLGSSNFARWAGAEVVGTCGPDNVEYVKSLGASEVIDYKTTDVNEWAASGESKKADLVIDCIRRKSLEDAWWAGEGWRSFDQHFPRTRGSGPAGFAGNDIKNLFFGMETKVKLAGRDNETYRRRKFVPALDSIFPLEKFEKGFAKLESGKTRGKVVLDMGL